MPDLEKEKDASIDLKTRAISAFTPATRAWFSSAFACPTPVQVEAWSAIGGGGNTLVIAPTGSGKTLAAFLHSIDQLFSERERHIDGARPASRNRPQSLTRVLYVSPIKALAADVQRNLRLPLEGVNTERRGRGDPDVEISVGMRTGDTPSVERAALLRRPPDILITTPESLYLMLTSKARETLRGVTTVIIDEVHAVASTKRGSHLALSLERLDLLLAQPAQRIGLSATVRPVERVAAFLGGARETRVVNPVSSRTLDLKVVVPVDDMTDIPARGGANQDGQPSRAGSIWPHVEADILDQVLSRQSTIVFTNSRGIAEKLTARLNELYAERTLAPPADSPRPVHYESTSGGTAARSAGVAPLIARAHHGSVSKEQRGEIEAALKSGELRCVVATSSLELGIDMGLVDLVIQVSAPPSVASALQRIGRAGHQVGGTSSGLIYPRTRRDLVDATVAVDRMFAGQLEAIDPPRNPLDVLAQQTVAAVAVDTIGVEGWYRTVRQADPFRTLPRSVFDATLDMLAGRYPSDEFADFRPRLIWDRENDLLSARPGAQQLAIISGGTIPDRGMFSVMLPEGEEKAGSRRVGELDEEMVYESRVNDIITLGATSWRIQQITNDQVVVVPAPGRSARLPFWRGDGPGRPAELGEAIGAFLRELDIATAGKSDQDAPDPRIQERLQVAGLDANAISNLWALVVEQRQATATLPTDRTLVIERCRDETGDWRVILHSPYGQRVHGPWALAIAERIRSRLKIDPSVVSSDDGIIARIPDMDGRIPGAELFAFDPDAMQRIVMDAVGSSALFAARFRECAARALLLPRRNPGRRSPLWQQRLRAGQLLEIAREHADFPILIETARECLQDVYDLSALRALFEKIENGAVRFAETTTETPSPFAAGLLFGYVAEFMYEGDAPAAERRASVLSLDTGLLGDLLDQVDIGEILDPAVVARMGDELQRLALERRANGVEGLADLLRELGPLSLSGIAERMTEGEEGILRRYLEELGAVRRAIPVKIGDEERWAAVEDAARLRDALGISLPSGIPDVFLQPMSDPLHDLVSRYARSHSPFTTKEVAVAFGIGVAVADGALGRMRDQGKLLKGSFGVERRLEAREEEVPESPVAKHEWVNDEVFRRLRLRSLQAARQATRPVPRNAYVRLLLERHGLIDTVAGHPAVTRGSVARGVLEGIDGVARVVEQLSGVPILASLWEAQILPSRVHDFHAGMLDELISAGEVVWEGRGRSGDNDGFVSLHLRELATDTLNAEPSCKRADLSDLQRTILDVLDDGGGYFARQLAALAERRLTTALGRENLGTAGALDPEDLHEALWDLAWSGFVTTDSWAPLKAIVGEHGIGRFRPQNSRRPQRLRIQLRGGGEGGGMTLQAPPLNAPTLAGRWSLIHREPSNDTERAFGLVEGLLDRHAIVTRGAVMVEGVPGGFPSLQPVFRAFEDAGRILRGRFVEGLGAAQFADRAQIERLRELASDQSDEPVAVALSALDPANPFGTVLAWPQLSAGARPVRRGSALLVVCDGCLALYLSPGRRQLLSYLDADAPSDAKILASSLMALSVALRRERRASFTLETVNDEPVSSTKIAEGLRTVGFSRVPKGLAWFGR